MELVYVDRGELHNLVGGVDIALRQQELLADWPECLAHAVCRSAGQFPDCFVSY